MEKTKPTPKRKAHDDDEDERTEKSANDSDLSSGGMNLAAPASKKLQRLLSSPPPLPVANDAVTDSYNPETGDRMDLDDTSSGRDAIILDTSQASWNRSLESAAAPEIPKLSPPKSDSGDDGHVRKKPKPDIEVSFSQDDVSIDCQLEDQEPDCDKTNRESGRMPSQTFLSKKPGTLSKASLAPPKSQKNPRQNLRSHIVGYARTGSQISLVPEKLDASEDEEVDQLLSDAVEAPDNLPAQRDIQLASPNNTDHPTAAIDDVERSVPPVRTDIPDSVALTLNQDDDVEDPSSLLSQARASSLATSSVISADKVYRPEIIRSGTTGADISLKFNIDKVKQVWADRPKKAQGGGRRESVLEEVLVDAGVANTENDEKAVDALSRVIEKDDFATMDIVGQFNLGFIVVRLRKTVVSNGSDDPDEMDDLFIVDQHAADEKYNFETLQSTTVIQSQKLFR